MEVSPSSVYAGSAPMSSECGVVTSASTNGLCVDRTMIAIVGRA